MHFTQITIFACATVVVSFKQQATFGPLITGYQEHKGSIKLEIKHDT